MKLRTLLAVAVLGCGTASQAFAQDASLIEDLQFAQQLRTRGDHVLAMEFLKRLNKNPSPELAKQLQTLMYIGMALIEGVALLGIVLCFMVAKG